MAYGNGSVGKHPYFADPAGPRCDTACDDDAWRGTNSVPRAHRLLARSARKRSALRGSECLSAIAVAVRRPTFLSFPVLRKDVPLILARNVALMTSLARFAIQLVYPAPFVKTPVSPAARRAVALAVFTVTPTTLRCPSPPPPLELARHSSISSAMIAPSAYEPVRKPAIALSFA
jgi:hypothetical protein